MASVGVACIDQTPTSPSANALIVNAVLDLAARNQYVTVQSTTGATSQQKAVIGAVVSITIPGGRELLAEEILDSAQVTAPYMIPRLRTIYRISLDRHGVELVPGGTYHLRVATPDGRVATGSTTIPQAATYTITPQALTIERLRDTFRLSVPKIPGASAYEIFVASPFGGSALFSDTAVVLPGVVSGVTGGIVFHPSMSHVLVVSAVDANYYDFYRRTTDFFDGAGLINRLDGAIGVFGSIVPIARCTVTVR
ncbi:MAG TPA: DUF4249 family protein [Gemmatimonadaceae bacterium]